MRSKSINVHALMDESEDPLEILEAYFSSTVMNLTEKGPGAISSVSSPFHRSPTSSGSSTPSKQHQQQQQQTPQLQRESPQEVKGRVVDEVSGTGPAGADKV